jgi:hypothetical protein
MHSKHAIVLEDEPKNITPDKLISFHGDITITRASAYEYINMLRTEGGGYGSPDESSNHGVSRDLPIEGPESQVVPSNTPRGKACPPPQELLYASWMV